MNDEWAEKVRTTASQVLSAATLKRGQEIEADILHIFAEKLNLAPPVRYESIQGGYAWITEEFEKFTTPTDADADSLMSTLTAAKENLTDSDASYLNAGELKIGGWTGKAFDAFESNYINSFPEKKATHIELIESLQKALTAHQELCRRMMESVTNVGNSVISQLHDYDPYFGNTIKDAKFALTIAGTIVSLPGAAGAPIGVAITLLSTAITSIEHALEGANNVNACLANMKNALTTIAEEVKAEEDKIATTIKNNMTALDNGYEKLVPPYPTIADINPKKPDSRDVRPPGTRVGWKVS